MGAELAFGETEEGHFGNRNVRGCQSIPSIDRSAPIVRPISTVIRACDGASRPQHPA
jgi:hypothetical protein